ncbi:MAG: hypothetical protein J6T84_10390, partial [Spirochaetaceae bacterium]|nr:hypothetical protein [Spirochaetaceae bacterium]
LILININQLRFGAQRREKISGPTHGVPALIFSLRPNHIVSFLARLRTPNPLKFKPELSSFYFIFSKKVLKTCMAGLCRQG